jgi:hypothetical protein
MLSYTLATHIPLILKSNAKSSLQDWGVDNAISNLETLTMFLAQTVKATTKICNTKNVAVSHSCKNVTVRYSRKMLM